MSRIQATLLVFLAIGCGTIPTVRTLGAGESEGTLSIGGPVIGIFGTYIPVPIVELGGLYGLTDDLTVHGRLNVTTAVFGTFGIDLGATWQVLRQAEASAIPALALGITAYGFANPSDFYGAADVSLAASWRIRTRDLAYLALRNFVGPKFDVRSAGSVGWLPEIALGYEWRVAEPIALVLEAGWAAPFTRTAGVPVGYSSFGAGAFPVNVAVRFYPGQSGAWERLR